MKILFAAIISVIILFIVIFFKDVLKNREKISSENGSAIYYLIAEFTVWFAATFGISDSALNTIALRRRACVPLDILPGTFVVGSTVPISVIGLGYVNTYPADMKATLIMMAAGAAGAFAGAAFAVKINGKAIKNIMAALLMATAVCLIVKYIITKGADGTSVNLTGMQLAAVTVISFVSAELAMVGFGATAPIISVMMIMGIATTTIMPMVMCMCSLISFTGSVKFIKSGRYHKKAAVCEVIAGTAGAIAALQYIQNINTFILQIIMIGVILYSSISLIADRRN